MNTNTLQRIRRLIAASAAALFAAHALPVLAVGNGNGIEDSPHDFSSSAWNGRNEICRVCHVPHDHGRASQRYLNGLLWNHGVSSATYTMYDSSTMDADAPSGPDGHSKLCLGCHDGTVAVDTFDKYAGGAIWIDDFNITFKIPGFTIGSTLDLTGTHPISIAYDAGDQKLHDATLATWNSGDTVASTLDNGKVQCSTCHDVHDQESVGGTRLLRTAQAAAFGASPSAMCLTCHVK